jgi:hypothetical protein
LDALTGKVSVQWIKLFSRSEPHFQHLISLSDGEEVGDPDAAVSVRAGHNDAAQPSQDASGPAKSAHQDGSDGTHRSLVLGALIGSDVNAIWSFSACVPSLARPQMPYFLDGMQRQYRPDDWGCERYAARCSRRFNS